VQETFLILLCKIEELSRHPNLAGWLYKTAQNLAKRELHSARHSRELPLNEDIAAARAGDVRDDLFEVLPSGLSAAERDILTRRYLRRMPHEEIADELGISTATCHMRLHRARQHALGLLNRDEK